MMEIIEQFSNIANSLKEESYRQKIEESAFTLMKETLEQTCNNKQSDSLQVIFHIFRCLRNACVHSTRNQRLILKCGILQTVIDVTEGIISPDFQVADVDTDLLNKVKVTAIQFLGNFIVQNKETQQAVWKIGFPTFFFNLMSNFNVKEKDLVCMVIYNCLKTRSKLFLDENEYWLLVSIADYCRSYQDSEWGLFILELMITSDDFVMFYKELMDRWDLKTSLVELMLVYLTGTKTIVPEEHLLFLCEEFIAKSKCIMILATTVSADVEELHQQSTLLLKILSALCHATAEFKKYKRLRANESMLVTLIELLREKQKLRKGSEAGIKANRENVDETSPSLGFERDLVRVIGNMCYGNKLIQDKVRDEKGIELLLNACNIDDSNPFIMQWAIFAIHNICEANLENQQYIAALGQQGLAPNHILKENNVKATLEDGKIRIHNQTPKINDKS